MFILDMRDVPNLEEIAQKSEWTEVEIDTNDCTTI